MKTSTLFLAFALIASGAVAQEVTPDYSRPTLLRIVVEAEKERSPITIENGALTLTTPWTRFSIPMHPMMPLQGSRPVVSQVLPDAFSLTGTALATMPRSFPKVEIEGIDIGRRARITVRTTSQ